LTLLDGRQEGHPACKKTEWWGAGMVICLERGADLHMAQLVPLPLTVSCFSKIHIGFTFVVPAHPGSPGKRAVKRVCVCCCLINVPDVSHPVSICGIWIDVNIYFVVPCIWTLINSVATLLKLHSLDYRQVGNLCINYQHSVAGNMVLHSNAHTCSCKGITALEMAEGKPPYGDIHPMRVCIVPLLVIKLNNWNLVVKWKLFFFVGFWFV